MVSIFRHGSKLYVQFTVAGKKRQKSTGLEDTPANRRLIEKELIPKLTAKIVSGEFEEELEKKSKPKYFEVYAEKYLHLKEGLKTYWELQAQVERIVQAFGKKREIDSITRGDVKEWVALLLRKLTPKTTRRYINVLAGILDVAIDHEIITQNPAKDISLPRHTEKQKEPFSPAEVERLLNVMDGWFRNYLAIAFFTGMRPGEILALTPQDINLHRRIINVSKAVRYGKVSTPKTKYSIRQVPIFEPLIPYLEDQLDIVGKYLFETAKGKPFYGASKLHTHWKRALDAAGLPHHEFYTTRHTFITAMLKSGTISILELAQIVGHKNSTEIMQNYARFIDGEHLRIRRDLNPFAVNPADTKAKSPINWG